ncbi:MAG: hypothetical protein ABIQ01_04735 [Pseudolysinimonas sp.]
MTRSRTKRRTWGVAALGMLLVLALAGCVRFQADLNVSDHDTLDGNIVVAIITTDEPGSADNAREGVANIEAQLLAGLRGADGVTAEPYEQDDYVGTRFTLKETPIDALDGGDADGALHLTRSGDVYEFSGRLDFTPDDEPLDGEDVQGDPADSNLTVAISFPGDVLEHNGELSGTKVTWTTTLEGSVDMEARASAIPNGLPAWLWLIVVLAVLLIAAAVIIVLVRRRRASTDSPAG